MLTQRLQLPKKSYFSFLRNVYCCNYNIDKLTDRNKSYNNAATVTIKIRKQEARSIIQI